MFIGIQREYEGILKSAWELYYIFYEDICGGNG